MDKGLVRSIGLTNFSPEKIEEWFSDARMFPAVNQVCCQADCYLHCMCRCIETPCHAAGSCSLLNSLPCMHHCAALLQP